MRLRTLFFFLFSFLLMFMASNEAHAEETTFKTIPFYISEGRNVTVTSNHSTYMAIMRADTNEVVKSCTSCNRLETTVFQVDFSGPAYLQIYASEDENNFTIESGYDFNTAYIFDFNVLPRPSNPNGSITKSAANISYEYFIVYLMTNKKYLWSMENATVLKIYNPNKELIKEVNGDKLELQTDLEGYYYIYSEVLPTQDHFVLQVNEMIVDAHIPQDRYYTMNSSNYARYLEYAYYFPKDRSVEISTTNNNSNGFSVGEVYTDFFDESEEYTQESSQLSYVNLKANIEPRYQLISFLKASDLVMSSRISIRDGSDFDNAYLKLYSYPEENSGWRKIVIPANEDAYFQLNVQKNREYEISFGDSYGYVLYNSNREEIKRSDFYDVKSTNPYDRKEQFIATEDGTYYIKLIGNSTSKTSVSLLVNKIYNIKDFTVDGINTYKEDFYYDKSTAHIYAIKLNQNYEYSFGATSTYPISFELFSKPISDYSPLAKTPYEWNNKQPIKTAIITYRPRESGVYYLQIKPDESGFIKLDASSEFTGKMAKKYIISNPKYAYNYATYVADPIDSSSGAFVTDKQLLKYSSYNPLSFKISYNSLLLNDGDLGKGWTHDFQPKLTVSYSGPKDISWTPNRKNTFTSKGSGLYVPNEPSLKYATLQKQSDGTYILTLKDKSIYKFGKDGLLIENKNIKGDTFSYTYENSKVKTVTQLNTGHSLLFTYDANGKLVTVSDNLNRTVSFTYNTTNNLTSITDAKGQTTNLTYDYFGQILTITDHEGIKYVDNTYDSFGRVVSQLDGEGSISTFKYDDLSENGKIITYSTNREGKTRTLIHNQKYELIEVINELGNSTKYEYDVNGNKIAEVDSKGNRTTFTYDERGNVLTQTNAQGHATTKVYDSNDNVLQVIDSKGNTITNVYDSKNNLISMTDANGNVTLYTYDDKGLLLTITSPSGAVITNEYTNGQLTKTIDGENNITVFEYDVVGRLISSTDSKGYVNTIKYDNNDNIIEKVNPLLHKTSFTYNSHGDMMTKTNVLGDIITYQYDANGNLLTETKGNKVLTYEYDKEGKLLKSIDTLGNYTGNVYDAIGNLIKVTDKTGKITTFQYDSLGNLLSKTIDGTITTSYRYDNLNRLIEETNAEGNITTYVYNEINQLVETINAKGSKVSFTYDNNGNKLTETDHLGNSIIHTYNANNKLSSTTDSKGHKNSFEYDKNNRLVKTTNHLNHSLTYAYDVNNNLIQITDAKGNVSKKEYDKLNRVIKEIDSKNNILTYEYNALGNISAVYDAKGNKVSENIYDNDGNLITQKDVFGNETKNEYNSENKLIKTIDALSNAYAFTNDKLGRVITSKDPNSVESGQTYTALGQIDTYTDTNGNTTDYVYNKLGLVLEEINATGYSKKYQYDEVGQLVNFINARNQSTSYQYDDVGNLINQSDNVGTISYSYDTNYNLLSVQEGTKNAIKREYDELDRLVKYTDEYGNVIHYAYDEVGNLITLTYPGGKQVHYTYDSNGNLTSVTDWNSKTTSYTYDKNNRLTKIVRPDGSIETRTFDIKGQLLEIMNSTASAKIIRHDTFTYDAVGNVLTESDKTYTYDNLYRLLSGKGNTYQYDNGGNLLSAVNSAINSNFSYGKDNRLATYNGLPVQYDEDGNLLNIPINGQLTNAIYDSRNRLTQIGDTQYTYDAENNRIAVSENGVVNKFVINPNAQFSQVLMDLDEQGNPKAYYVYGMGLVSKEDVGSNETYYYHFDRRGSTIALANSTGEITDTYEYDNYGELLNRTGETENHFLYNGRDGVQTDSNGLYYMRNRYYSPEIKRFVNRDVVQGNIVEPQTFNRYAYVNGNPISYIDPFGLSRESDSGGFGEGLTDSFWESTKGIGSFIWKAGPIHNTYKLYNVSKMSPEEAKAEYEYNLYMLQNIHNLPEAVWTDIKDSFMNDVVNGNKYTRGNYIGGLVPDTLFSVFTGGTGGVAAKTAKTGAKAIDNFSSIASNGIIKTTNNNASIDNVPKYNRKEYYGSTPTPKSRKEVLERDNYTCQYCGDDNSPFPYEADHNPTLYSHWHSEGHKMTQDERTQWANDPNNLVTACRGCNRSKREKNYPDEWTPDDKYKSRKK